MDFLKIFKKKVLLFAVLVIIVWSCGEILDTDDYDIKGVEASPTYALPLAYGDLSIQDLLSRADSTHIKVDGDGLVYLEYDQTLKTQAVRDLVVIPDKNNVNRSVSTGGPIPPNTVDQTLPKISQAVFFDMDFEKLTEVLFNQGLIEYSLSSTNPDPAFRYAIILSIPELAFSAELVPNGPLISLAGYMYSSSVPNQLTIELAPVIRAHSNTIPVTTITANLSFKGMNYQYAKGFFGDQTTEVLEENIDINAFGNSLTNSTNIFFANPKLEFTVINSVGVPTKVYFQVLEARKPGASLPIQITPASPLTINAPATLGTTATTLVTVNNVMSILNFAPTQLYYRFVARINENLTFPSAGTNNFVSDTSTLRVNMHIEVPMYGHASNIRLSDTLAIDLDDIDQSNVESAKLKVKATNEIPLEAFIQFYLTTDNYVVIDSLFTPDQTLLVNASQVDNNGELQTPGLKDDLIEINKDKLNKIFQAKKIIIRARMNTSNTNGTFPNVKFKASQKIDIKLGLQAKLKINIDL